MKALEEPLHKILIENESDNGDSPVTKVLIDGREMKGVLSVSFEHTGGEIPKVILKLLANEVNIKGAACVDSLRIRG